MMEPLPKAILFDLDDTILSLGSPKACWQRVCEGFADRLNGMKSDAMLAVILEMSVWYWSDPERHRRGRLDLTLARREVVAGAFQKMGLEDAALANEIADTFNVAREAGACLFPDAIDTLDRIRKRGVLMALITNGGSEIQRGKIERFGLAPFFDLIQIEGELGFGKPDERAYRHALAALGVRPEETWMVGDNLEWEVVAPQRLGISAVWHDWQGTGLPEGSPVRPDRIIGTLAELIL